MYALCRGDAWMVLVVERGGHTIAARCDRLSRMEPNDPLAAIDQLFDREWPGADAIGSEPAIPDQAMVRHRDSRRVGRVTGRRRVSDSFVYQIVTDGVSAWVPANNLDQVQGDPGAPEFWIQDEPARAEALGLTLTWLKLSNPLTDVVYSFQASKTVFRAYQFRPVLKMVSGGHHRLLIADEVGLGKTIEAGLIWNELEHRVRLRRVLVVAPAVLVYKWKTEMQRRFDRQLELLDVKRLGELLDAFEEGNTDVPLVGVISLERLRTASQLDRLSELRPPFDLVIVDEAHYLRNQTTKNHAVGRLLADCADALVFLSATPINLRSRDLFNLLSLLHEEVFNDENTFDLQIEPNRVLNEVARSLALGASHPRVLLRLLDNLSSMPLGPSITRRPDFVQLCRLLDVDRRLNHAEIARSKRHLAELNTLSSILTRTRKADVPDAKAVREPITVDVNWTQEEQDFYDAVEALAMEEALRSGQPYGFAMQMPLRHAASCIPAMQELLRERTAGERADDAALEGAEDEPDLYEALSLRQKVMTPIGTDTKFDQLLLTLREARSQGLRQVMIFSFFRRTLGYLARRLQDEFSVRVMHGGVAMPDREQIMSGFRAGEFDLLLLSEVGSEGLDFEFCNVLVNYDLPWNPMRVEQRIGRLDRFGQQHEKIFIYNMRVPGTIESRIFHRLYERIDIFRNSIGDLEPILHDRFESVAARLFDPRLSDSERDEQLERIAVAMHGRGQQIEELHAASGLLAGLDQLAVEGFDEQGPRPGRCINQGEITASVRALVESHGGSLRSVPDQPSRLRIKGTPELSARLLRSRMSDHGTPYGRGGLANRLREGQPLEVTLSSDDASRTSAELLSVRHPLVKLAVEVLGEDPLRLRRFGSVQLPTAAVEERALVLISLVESTGLRPTLELWASAVGVRSRDQNEVVGDLLLDALAAGRLKDGDPAVPSNIDVLLRCAQDALHRRQMETERRWRTDNEALVDARIESRRQSVQIKIRRTVETLEKVRQAGRELQVQRIHEGRLRNLQQDLTQVDGELAAKRAMSVHVREVAVVLVDGG
ncbi:MAG: helicase-related protein [Kineosporiaceae bacterium]